MSIVFVWVRKKIRYFWTDLLAPPSSEAAVAMGANRTGWNADPNDGRNLKPAGGLNIADDADECSVSVDFKQT